MLRIAMLQLKPTPADVEANRLKGLDYCRQAALMGADIALLPEMWSTGYHFPDTPPWHELAVSADSPFVQSYCDLARELDMAIGLTYLEAWPGGPRNSLSLIDRRGRIVMTFAKVHTCDFGKERECTRGDDFPVAELDTARDTVRVGAMICYDREFPESARVLMLKGAELILIPNACDMEPHRLMQLHTRAYENMLALAMTTYPAPRFNGQSIALDGIAFGSEGESRDMCLTHAGSEEGIYLADFDLDALREYRQREVWGDAFRRPDRYGLLAQDVVQPPFERPRARR